MQSQIFSSGGLTIPLANSLYIRIDGTSVTTASIPFALGLSVASTQPVYFGGTSDSTAVASILNSSTSLNITGLISSVGVNGPNINITAGAGSSATGGNGGYPTLFGGAGNNNGDIIGTNGFARTGTTVSGFNPTNNITGIFSAGNNTFDFAVGNDLYVFNNTTLGNGLGLYGKSASTIGYSIITTGESNQIIGMDRTGSGTNGFNFTIQAGWAKSGGTNLNAGNLILAPGKSTGTGIGNVLIQAVSNGSSGTSDVTPFTVATWDGRKVTLQDGYDFVIGTTTGTKIGTGSTQKIGLWGVTPVVQQANSTSLETVLSNIGARVAGSAAPITIGTFSSTSTTDSTTTTTGGGKFSGGVGIAKTLHVGTGVSIDTVGFGLSIKTGSNAKIGTGTLTAGTVTISTTAVHSTSFVFLTDTGSSITNLGNLQVSAIVDGTSFTVQSSNILDTSTFNWIIIDPS